MPKLNTANVFEAAPLLADTDVASMRLEAISQDDTGVLRFPGGPSNHNNALRTLRRMLGKAEEWRVLRAAPKIKLKQERERERIIDEHVEPGFCLFANSRFETCS